MKGENMQALSPQDWEQYVDNTKARWQQLQDRAAELGLPPGLLFYAGHLSAEQMGRYSDSQIALMAESLHFPAFMAKTGGGEDGLTCFVRIFPGFNTPAIRQLLTEGYSQQF